MSGNVVILNIPIYPTSHAELITLKFSAVSAIDTSGISLFKELKTNLEKKGVEARTLLSLTYA